MIEAVFGTLTVFGVMGLFAYLPLNLNALQPLENAIAGFDMMDLYYSQLRGNEGNFSKNVIIVNIGDAGRAEIAELIEVISIGEPKAIGVDVFFAEPRNNFADTLLSDVVKQSPNVVMASYWDEESSQMVSSASLFQSKETGFTNFIGVDPRFSTIRYFSPQQETEDQSVPAFAVAIAALADSANAAAFLIRNNSKEAIRYTGNLESFLFFDKDEVLGLEVDPEVFAGKVVLLGFMGNYLEDPFNFEDRFFTPLNEQISGRSVPDMNGVVIHANIIEMILTRNWVNSTGFWFKIIFSFVITYLHVLFYMYLIIKWDLYFDAWSKVLQILSTMLLIYIVFLAYHYFNFRMYITPGLVGVALAVDVLFIYEAVVNTLYKKYKIKSVLIEEE